MAGPNIAFLNELMQNIGAGVRWRASAPISLVPADRRLAEGCVRLMRRSGEASRIAVAAQALEDYSELDATGKARFFRMLLEEYSADRDAIRRAHAAFDEEDSEAALARLFAVVEPRRQTLLRRLNLAPGGTLRLVRMREDLLAAIRGEPDLAPLDVDFSHLLASWFNRGFLVMRQIDWNTPAAILEKIIAYEAVHEIRNWSDLRRRLEPADRRCYGFFHPATGNEPLIFVEVALCRGMPDAIAPLLEAGEGSAAGGMDTAVFYSISNCQPGLKGVSFGNFLIKHVARDLARDLPNLQTFVTLSPAPGFARWLANEPDDQARWLSAALAEGAWQADAALQADLAPQVQEWAARYFVEAKTASGGPVDPVARFHLGNGASAHRINWPGDLAAGALTRSHGVMINYLYEPDEIEARHEAFVADGTIVCGPELRRTLQSARKSAT